METDELVILGLVAPHQPCVPPGPGRSPSALGVCIIDANPHLPTPLTYRPRRRPWKIKDVRVGNEVPGMRNMASI